MYPLNTPVDVLAARVEQLTGRQVPLPWVGVRHNRDVCARFIIYATNESDVGSLHPVDSPFAREGLLGHIAQYGCEMNRFPRPVSACGRDPELLREADEDRHVYANVPWFRRLPDVRDLDQCTFGECVDRCVC